MPEQEIEFLPLPEGAQLEIGCRSEPNPLVGITLHLGRGARLAFTYTPDQAREIAMTILQRANDAEGGVSVDS